MSTETAEPRLSATVLLIRDREKMEVLMVARHYQIDFAAGALVFPGGKANDEDAHSEWDAFTDGDFEAEQQVARIAAVREAFEESGVLLARSADARGKGQPLVAANVAEALAPMRRAVDKGEQSFLGLIEEHGLVLALDELVHFGHWITPTMMPKRFNTHFYLAMAPDDQIASHDGHETTDARWLAPDNALEMADAEEVTIIFPTRMNLEKLSRENRCADVMKRFADETVVTVLPEVGRTDDGAACLRIPAEADYCQTVELLSRVKV